MKATRVSYVISAELAKEGKPFTEGELIIKCLIIACEELDPTAKEAFEEISLSRQTVTDRIGEISDQLQEKLAEKCTSFVNFSVALDESTDRMDTAQLAIFIRGVDENMEVHEEFLDIVPLVGTTTGEDVFDAVEKTFDKFGFLWARYRY